MEGASFLVQLSILFAAGMAQKTVILPKKCNFSLAKHDFLCKIPPSLIDIEL